MKCPKCLDSKFIADDDDQTAWVHIEEFAQKHPESAVAYRMGLVKKLPCPKCNADGEADELHELKGIGERIASIYRSLERIAVLAQETLTPEDLEKFSAHLETQEAVGWVLDPTTYRELSQGGRFEQVKERIALIRKLHEIAKKVQATQ